MDQLVTFVLFSVALAGVCFALFFWFYMLVGAMHLEKGINKIAWIVVILWFNLAGAIMYSLYLAFFQQHKSPRRVVSYAQLEERSTRRRG